MSRSLDELYLRQLYEGLKVGTHGSIPENLRQICISLLSELDTRERCACDAEIAELVLYNCAVRNCAYLVQLLLAAGISPDNLSNGFPPLVAASIDGSVEVLRLLVEGGADLNKRSNANARDAIWPAANKKSIHGYNALLLCAHRGHMEAARWVLKDIWLSFSVASPSPIWAF